MKIKLQWFEPLSSKEIEKSGIPEEDFFKA